MSPVAVIALVAGGLYLFNKAAKGAVIDRLNFVLDSVRISYDGISPILNITIKVQNPTNDSFTVRAITGNAFVNGQHAGNISSFQETIIKANSESSLPLKVRLSAGQLSEQIVNLIQGNIPNQVLVRLQGTANVDTMLFPVDLTYKIV